MIAPNLYRAEELTYRQIQGFAGERSICFLPVSALEVHGPHLPLGVDMFVARWMAEETARRFAQGRPDWSVVVYPPLTLGTDELPLAGSMHATQQTVYRTVISHGRSLAQAGYRYVVVTNGHGGARHPAALEAACRHVSRRCGIAMFTPSIAVYYAIVRGQRFDQIEQLIGRPLTAEERTGLLSGEHAGSWETSFMLAERPELVDRQYRELALDGPPPLRPLAALRRPVASLLRRFGQTERARLAEEVIRELASGIGWLLNARYGYGGPKVSYQGDPSVASPEVGHAFREVVAADCLAIVEDVVEGRRRAEEVRSIASDPIIIHPLFWRRLALATGAILAAALILLIRPQGKAPSPQAPA